jgi:peptidoglycan hydrolase-like protein with peptidoglycan-binding domain
MFKKILKEINRTKKLMNLNESKLNNSVILGDDVVDLVDNESVEKILELSDDSLNIKSLITKLITQEERPEIKNVYFSIGKNDNFDSNDQIHNLSSILKKKFPNANLNVIKPILKPEEFDQYNGDFQENERNINKFYDKFLMNNINVVGNYRILDGEKSGMERKIKSLNDEILNTVFDKDDDSTIMGIQNVINNVDIQGEDETDFDTIYEFLNRFEKIVKSDNIYKKNMSKSFKPDIEQIQIALKFVDPSLNDIEVTGVFDNDTERAISKFQSKNNLEQTGIADSETIEELFYELKIKGFDEMDLDRFLKDLEVESGIKYSSDIDDSDGYIGGAGIAGASVGFGASLIDSGSTSRTAGSRSEDDRIYKAILLGIGAKPTEENILFFHAWRKAESGKATFNPFNTTQPYNDASKYNSVGVRNYNSEDDGIKATIKTMKNGHYPCILDGLRRDIGAKNISKNCLSNLKTWGTGDLIFKILNRSGSFTPTPIYRKI